MSNIFKFLSNGWAWKATQSGIKEIQAIILSKNDSLKPIKLL